MGDLA